MNLARIVDLSPKKRRNKTAYMKIMNKIAASEENVSQFKKAIKIFFHLRLKEKKMKEKDLKFAFIKLNLNNRRTILSRLVFIKLERIFYNRSRPFFYLFCSKASGKVRWRNVKDNTVLSEINVEQKISAKVFDKIKKVLNDISSGGNPLEAKVNFNLCKIFLNIKYALKILRLFYVSHIFEDKIYAFSNIGFNCFEGQTPKFLEHMIARKIAEKNEVESFLNTGEISKKKPPSQYLQIKMLHNSELKRLDEKMLLGTKITFRKKEQLLLSNWGQQNLNRISKYYRKEYLIWGFSRLIRYSQTLKYKKKLMFNLYEKYRAYRIRDITKCFLKWKMRSVEGELFVSIYTFVKVISKLKKKTLRSVFINLMNFYENSLAIKEKSPYKFSRKTKGALLLTKLYKKKQIIVKEMVFNRIKNETYLVELSNKISAIEKIDCFYKKKMLMIMMESIEISQRNMKNKEKIFRVLKYVLKIRKVICFYRIYSYARIMKGIK